MFLCGFRGINLYSRFADNNAEDFIDTIDLICIFMYNN